MTFISTLKQKLLKSLLQVDESEIPVSIQKSDKLQKWAVSTPCRLKTHERSRPFGLLFSFLFSEYAETRSNARRMYRGENARIPIGILPSEEKILAIRTRSVIGANQTPSGKLCFKRSNSPNLERGSWRIQRPLSAPRKEKRTLKQCPFLERITSLVRKTLEKRF